MRSAPRSHCSTIWWCWIDPIAHIRSVCRVTSPAYVTNDPAA